MKEYRHQKILEIIEQYPICTQEGILEKLHQAGLMVTQATVSRDMKQLNLVKRLTEDGRYIYTCQEKKTQAITKQKFHSIFSEAIISIDYAMNTVVIKCHVGMANAACTALDLMEWKEIVGTLAGDDTIFVLLKTPQQAEEFMRELKEIIR